MPSWMPGEDYYTDFHKGDPYVKVDQGFARLPGAGYAALHPELEDVNPEDYPDIHKMAIMADVAPYSREYNTFRLKVGNQARDNTELQIEYEKILERVRQTKESVIRMQDQVEELADLHEFGSLRPLIDESISNIETLRAHLELNDSDEQTIAQIREVGNSRQTTLAQCK